MRHDPRAFLWDARESADAIAEFIRERHLDDYLADEMLRSAVERKLEIVGEALNRLSREAPELINGLPELPQAVGLRNILIHGYATIDHDLVWRTAVESLPPLRDRLNSLLQELDGTEE